jgi:hypothetical protein
VTVIQPGGKQRMLLSALRIVSNRLKIQPAEAGHACGSLPSHLRQNNPTGKISLVLSGKSALPARPVLSRQEGRSRVVTNVGKDAVDAEASARSGVAGRVLS